MTYSKDHVFFKNPARAYPKKESLLDDLTLSELAFYFVMFYNILGPKLGLVVGDVGGGFLMMIVLAIWFMEGRENFASVMRQTYLLLGCGVAYIVIQLVIHEESSTHAYVRPYPVWVFSLIVVHGLVGRKNFFHRFAIVTILLGLAMAPYIKVLAGGKGFQRMGLERGVGFANPNDLGQYYGFCTLYLTIAGFAARETRIRVFFWLLALGGFFFTTLTVSRSPLVSMVASLMIAFRHLLKEGILTLIALLCLVLAAVLLGVFDVALQSYGARADEETGRLTIWPLLIERIGNSPLIGVGVSYVETYTPTGFAITPHNGVLLIAAASGIVPAALFIGHWIKAAKAALYTTGNNLPGSAFHLPLLTYAFLTMNSGNLVFMAPWSIVCLALPFAPSVNSVGCANWRKRTAD